MLLEFLKRAWFPSLTSVLGVSVVLAVLFSWAQGAELWIFATLVYANVIMSGTVLLFLGLPVAFWAWFQQQRRAVPIHHSKAAALGLAAGIVLPGAFLLCFGGFLPPAGTLLAAILCGGAYGMVFSLMFSLRGGLRLKQGEQAAAPGRPATPDLKPETSLRDPE